MEVGAAPPKWKFLKEHRPNRDRRARRCNVCVLDYVDDKPSSQAPFDNTTDLEIALRAQPQGSKKSSVRLLIVEDLSRDLVELLGARYDIDPLFFLSHIGDYLFHNTRDRWVELPDLDVVARQRPHFNLQYLRARYFNDPESFKRAERESGGFNVLRRLDSDRSSKRLQNGLLDVKGACVTLTRAKTSLWVKPRMSKDEPVIAILLVDPTVKDGKPLWGGYRPFEDAPRMNDETPVEAPNQSSLFDDAIYWSSRMTAPELASVRDDLTSRCIAIPMFRLVLADWRTVLKYMSTMLGKIEWEFEDPHWAEEPSDIDKTMRKLSPWRRNVPYYQSMIQESIDRIFRPEKSKMGMVNPLNTPTPNSGVLSLLYDFQIVQRLMDASQQRIDAIQTIATNSINIQESRRAVEQNQHLAKLTFLATIFIPLNFTSSFLSMSPNFAAAKQTIWMFFAIGAPLTLFALTVVDLSNPKQGLIRQGWRRLVGKKRSPLQPESRPTIVEGRTMPWSITQFESVSR